MTYISKKDFILEVAKGNIEGHQIMRGLGERNSIGTTVTGEDLWLGTATSIPIPADAGEQLSIVSSDNADNGATATGALTVTVSFLDASGNEATEVVTMNGTTAVDLTETNVRFVQDLQTLTVGSNGVCEGDITIYEKATPANIYSMIGEGGNQSLVPHKMVPLGKSLYLREWICSEKSSNKAGIIRLRADCSNAAPPVRQQGVFLFKSTMALISSLGQMSLAYSIPALSIVKASAWVDNAGADMACHWWGVLVDD